MQASVLTRSFNTHTAAPDVKANASAQDSEVGLFKYCDTRTKEALPAEGVNGMRRGQALL